MQGHVEVEVELPMPGLVTDLAGEGMARGLKGEEDEDEDEMRMGRRRRTNLKKKKMMRRRV